MSERRSRTLLWILIGGGAFFLFVLAVFSLVYLTLHAGSNEASFGGFGDRIDPNGPDALAVKQLVGRCDQTPPGLC